MSNPLPCPKCRPEVDLAPSVGVLDEAVCRGCLGRFLPADAAHRLLEVQLGFTPEFLKELSKHFAGDKRVCPGCRRRMTAVTLRGVPLEICEGCGGLWTDKGELTRLSGGMHEEVAPPPLPPPPVVPEPEPPPPPPATEVQPEVPPLDLNQPVQGWSAEKKKREVRPGCAVTAVIMVLGVIFFEVADKERAPSAPTGQGVCGRTLNFSPEAQGRVYSCRMACHSGNRVTAMYPMGGRCAEGEQMHGKEEGVWTYFFPNGTRYAEGGFRAGKKHGDWMRWHSNGSPHDEERFVNGARDGKRNTWFPNGARELEESIMQGVLEGKSTMWHSNGKLAAVGTYRGGKHHGEWKFYDLNGQLQSEGRYEGDRRRGVWKHYQPNVVEPRLKEHH